LRPILIRTFLPVAVVLLVAAGLGLLRLHQWRTIGGLRTELDALAPICARATELRLKLTAANAKLHELSELSKQLPAADWQQVFSQISQSMPDDVWLDRISVQDCEAAALSGASYSDSGVYDFVGYLKNVPGVADIALESTGIGQSDSGPTTNFELKLSLVDLAASADKEGSHD
jgi:Tfp pilus assembly protein PilN